jgi:hypothetical protein
MCQHFFSKLYPISCRSSFDCIILTNGPMVIILSYQDTDMDLGLDLGLDMDLSEF